MLEAPNEIYKELDKERESIMEKIISERVYFEGLQSAKEQFEYFKSNHAVLQMINFKQMFIEDYKSWNLPAIEEHITKLDAYRYKAFANEITEKQMSDAFYGASYQKLSEKYEIFKRLDNGYYENEKIPIICPLEQSEEAHIYGEYFLFYKFLLGLRRDVYERGDFSKLNQTTQIDKVLTILCNNPRDLGIQIDDLKNCVRGENYIITGQILLEILHNLIDDGYLIKIDDGYPQPNIFYRVTFKGRFFENNGGYAKAFEKETRERKTQSLKDILLIGGAWMASVAGSGLLYFEYIKLNHHVPYGFSFWRLCGMVSILSVPILIWWIVPKKK